jgi:Type II secretory pathway, prepilin signal peptidase PulO and related peptidases
MQSALLVVAAVLGAVVGSFLNVVIFRLPREGASIVFPASHCPRCLRPLAWYENIPVFSFLALRGRCRTCKVAISRQYPLVELTMAGLAVLVAHRFNLSFEALFYFIFCAALLVIIFIDIHHQIIPDCISLPGIVIGFTGSFFTYTVTWQQSGLGILIGGGLLYTVAYGYYALTGRDGMGGGDIKLLAMIGGFLGWQSLLYVIFASSLAGSLVGVAVMFRQKKGGQTRIPFGPFLALAALSYLFFQEQINAIWRLYLTGAGW